MYCNANCSRYNINHSYVYNGCFITFTGVLGFAQSLLNSTQQQVNRQVFWESSSIEIVSTFSKMSGPPEYDPRRLFPFGLSPIPEVPSELASEVSSMYSYAPDEDDESEADTEIEGTKTPGSIMYSGSCSSVRTNGTLEDKAQAVGSSSGSESSDEDTEEEETDDEGDKVIIEAKPVELYQEPENAEQRNDEGIESVDNNDEDEEEEVDDESEQEESESEPESSEDEGEVEVGNHYSSCVTAVTHQTRAIRQFEEKTEEISESEPMLAIVPSASSSNLDPSPGAICATEIFQHLQATRGKEEVTTELAKILNVLQTTLKEDSSSSSSSESESSDESKEASPEPSKTPPKPQPLGKPPVHPLSIRGLNQRRVAPEIQQKIKELAQLKPEKGKEEMSILSKILVTLLCSCKSAEATSELRKIIRHFREAASEASDEVDEEIRPIRSRAGRTTSRGSKRRQRSRSRRSSANSNTSQSEAESLTNTLTPCNTDSKSSGTEDEGPCLPKKCSGCHTPTNEGTKVTNEPVKETIQPDVSFTVSLPRRPSIEVAEITASISPTKMLQQNSNHQDDPDEDEEEEWEWEEDDDAASTRSRRSGKRVDSISSRDLSSAELKQDHSTTSSTRKILTDMECGAYNSDSLCSPGHNSGQSDGVSMSEQSHESPVLDEGSDLEEEDDEDGEEEEEEEEENLYSQLEETYRVLNGAYQIITGATSETIVKEETSSTITTVKEEVTNAVVQEEVSTTVKPMKLLSRPSSRQKISRPSSRRSIKNGNEEDNWGDDEEGDWEWEYYYEEEDGHTDDLTNNKESEKSPEKSVEAKTVEARPTDMKPVEILVNNEPPPPVAHQR